jgi:hypothetical protein
VSLYLLENYIPISGECRRKRKLEIFRKDILIILLILLSQIVW